MVAHFAPVVSPIAYCLCVSWFLWWDKHPVLMLEPLAFCPILAWYRSIVCKMLELHSDLIDKEDFNCSVMQELVVIAIAGV
jgi:hypothetical protein